MTNHYRFLQSFGKESLANEDLIIMMETFQWYASMMINHQICWTFPLQTTKCNNLYFNAVATQWENDYEIHNSIKYTQCYSDTNLLYTD